jgi:hypothetical protein
VTLDLEAKLQKVVDVARDARSSPLFLERMEQTHGALAEAHVFSCWWLHGRA